MVISIRKVQRVLDSSPEKFSQLFSVQTNGSLKERSLKQVVSRKSPEQLN